MGVPDLRFINRKVPIVEVAPPVRETSTYVLTPRSDEVLLLAQAQCAQMRDEITIQRKLRAEALANRKRSAY